MSNQHARPPFRIGPHGVIRGPTGIEVANVCGFIVWIVACVATPGHAAVILGARHMVFVYLLAALAGVLIAITLAACITQRAPVIQTVLVLSAVFWCFTGARFVAGGYQVVGVGMQFVMAAGSLRSAFA